MFALTYIRLLLTSLWELWGFFLNFCLPQFLKGIQWYSSHKICSSHLTGLVSFVKCITTTVIKIYNIFSNTKSDPFAVSLLSCPSASDNHWYDFHPYGFGFSRMSHREKIQYITFTVQFLLLSIIVLTLICIFACINISSFYFRVKFLCMVYYSLFIHSIHLFVITQLDCSQIPTIRTKLCECKNSHRSLCMDICFHFSWINIHKRNC